MQACGSRTVCNANDLCPKFGYHVIEERAVLHEDGHLLGVHRIPGPKRYDVRLGNSHGIKYSNWSIPP
ncbi:hypothetical protein BC826DRAFT_1025554 [Russula brevipes]|nr:hypothetical protein BC826DRAFT_1025554 [Russula brevipes]